MSYIAGIDLHSNNSYAGLIDKDGKKIFQKKLDNDLSLILRTLEPFKKELKGIVVESTFNWYWLVDGLMEAGYKVHLANPCAIQQYCGLKFSDDKSDAYWLAEMLRLDILPEGYIYPRKDRGIRDQLRKRLLLVVHSTAIMLSLKGMINNVTGSRITRTGIQELDADEITRIFLDDDYQMSGHCLNEAVSALTEQVKRIEQNVLKKIRLRKAYKNLTSVIGIGKILALTIMLETGGISRFPSVGDYSSYCRCVPSKRISNEKKKGKGNTKNGNRYLAWAFIEAAHYMKRFCPKARKWHQKKSAKSGSMVATKALSNKVARACYFIMRDQTVCNPAKLFN
jgi:transposase